LQKEKVTYILKTNKLDEAFKETTNHARQVLKLRKSSILERQLLTEIDEFASEISTYVNTLREELTQVLNLMKNDKWEFDVLIFIEKLDKLKGISYLQELQQQQQQKASLVLPYGYFCGNEYVDVMNQLRNTFMSIWKNMNESDLNYENPAILSSFLPRIRILVQFGKVFHHQLNVISSNTAAALTAGNTVSPENSRKRGGLFGFFKSEKKVVATNSSHPKCCQCHKPIVSKVS
jgi:hypothetical protein